MNRIAGYPANTSISRVTIVLVCFTGTHTATFGAPETVLHWARSCWSGSATSASPAGSSSARLGLSQETEADPPRRSVSASLRSTPGWVVRDEEHPAGAL